MEFTYGVPGNTGGRGRARGKNISSYLKDLLAEQHAGTGQPKSKIIAEALVNLALDTETHPKLRLDSIALILDRMEGKAVQLNANADVAVNPFDGIDTTTLERLKDRLTSLASEDSHPAHVENTCQNKMLK